MISAAPRVDQMPRRRRVNHSAAVAATIAITTDRMSNAGLYDMLADTWTAAMPV
jgi:hypothetical protein